MRQIFVLNNQNDCYPSVFIPDEIINFIENGYDTNIIAKELGLAVPQKLNYIHLENTNNNYYLLGNSIKHFRKEKILIDDIFALKNNTENKDLEENNYLLDNVLLPKKPKFYDIELVTERNKFQFSNENIIKSILLAFPIISLLFAIIYDIIFNLFLNNSYSIIRTAFLSSAIITGIFTFYIILQKIISFSTFQEVERKILKSEDKRNYLLNDYWGKVKIIINDYNEEFNQQLLEFEKKIFEQKISTEVKIFSKANSSRLTILDNVKDSKKGKNELFFLKYLIDYFGKNVFTDMHPVVGHKSFNPDFIIFDEELNLYFDIEIDEPYVLNEEITIHHNRTNDSLRNIFFNDLNWIVIRFSEKQIVTEPTECCEFIENIILSIKYRKAKTVHFIPLDKFWTHEEALIMFKNNYRESY